jgi:hypothetical protein
LPLSCFTCELPAEPDERPWIGFAGLARVDEVSGEDGDGVWDVEDEVMGCAVNIAVEPLMASELVSEALV